MSGTYKDYYTLVLIIKDRDYFQYNSGDVVYIISLLTSQLGTASRKVVIKYVVFYMELVQGLQNHKSGNRKYECTSVPVIVILFPAINHIWSSH